MDGETRLLFANEPYQELGAASAAALVDVRRSDVFDADVSQQEPYKWPAKTTVVARL
jgi:hypothetical protein